MKFANVGLEKQRERGEQTRTFACFFRGGRGGRDISSGPMASVEQTSGWFLILVKPQVAQEYVVSQDVDGTRSV